MIGLDTNILIAAHRKEAPNHQKCRKLFLSLAAARRPFCLFWPSLYEFLRVVTHHRVFNPPSTVAQAAHAIHEFTNAPGVMMLREGEHHLEILQSVLKATDVQGNLMHDAHIVALAIEHGVEELITYDRDFARFPQIRSRVP